MKKPHIEVLLRADEDMTFDQREGIVELFDDFIWAARTRLSALGFGSTGLSTEVAGKPAVSLVDADRDACARHLARLGYPTAAEFIRSRAGEP